MKTLFIGIIIILCGIVILFNQMDLLSDEVSDVLISWQMLLIAIGIINLYFHKGRTSGYILIAVGAFFLLPKFVDTEEGFFWTYWPILLILIGIMIIIRHLPANRRAEPFKGQSEPLDEGYLDDFNLFSGGKKVLHNQKFRGGRSTSIFGGSEIDLRFSELADGPVVLEIFCLFGGSEIIVPPDWKIQNNVTSIFGGFSDSRKYNEADNLLNNKILSVKGTVLFGGCEIKS